MNTFFQILLLFRYRYCFTKQFFRTSAFEYDEAVVEQFHCAKVVSIAEAIGSPPKKRLSIEGKVIKVRNIVIFY